jgi:hypothetical protein
MLSFETIKDHFVYQRLEGAVGNTVLCITLPRERNHHPVFLLSHLRNCWSLALPRYLKEKVLPGSNRHRAINPRPTLRQNRLPCRVFCFTTLLFSYFCGKGLSNPIFDYVNFDTIFYSFIMVFQSVTMEGWTVIQYYVFDAFS